MPYLPPALKKKERGPVTRVRIIETGKVWTWQQVKKKGPLSHEVEDLKIKFRVDFANDAGLKWGEVRILGVGPEEAEKFRKGYHLELSAGWRWDDPSNWFHMNGTIEQVQFSRENDVTWGVQIVFYDAPEKWLTPVVAKSYKPGTMTSRVFRDIVASYLEGLELVSYKPKRDVIYRRGRSFPGVPVRWAIEDVAKDMASRVFVWNRGIYLHGPGKGFVTGVFLDYDHGLMMDQKLDYSAEAMPAVADEYSALRLIKALLQPRLGPDGIFHLKSKYMEDDLRVLYGSHWSDGMKWQTEVVCTTSDDFSLDEFAMENLLSPSNKITLPLAGEI